MGLLRDYYGIAMGLLWDCYGITMGLLWDYYGTAMGEYLEDVIGEASGSHM